MAGIAKNVVAQADSAIKEAVNAINAQVKILEAKRAALMKALDQAPAAQKASKTKEGAVPRVKGTRGPGILSVLLPFMEGKPAVNASDMLTHMHAHASYGNLKPNVLYATLAAELKRANSRVEKLSPGNYRVSAAYFENRQPQTQAAAD